MNELRLHSNENDFEDRMTKRVLKEMKIITIPQGASFFSVAQS